MTVVAFILRRCVLLMVVLAAVFFFVVDAVLATGVRLLLGIGI